MSVIILLLLSSCASSGSGYRMAEPSDEGSRASPAAYGSDGFTFRKDQPSHHEDRPWDFYYKHCAMNGDETVYSIHSYDCSGPSF